MRDYWLCCASGPKPEEASLYSARKSKKYLQYEYTVDITGRNLDLTEMRVQIVSGVDDVSSF